MTAIRSDLETPKQATATGPVRLTTDGSPGSSTACVPGRPACPLCGASLFEQRAKLICSRCRTVCETCCEGGPG